MERRGAVHLYYRWWPYDNDRYEVALPAYHKDRKRHGPKDQFYFYPSNVDLGKKLWAFNTEAEARTKFNLLVEGGQSW